MVNTPYRWRTLASSTTADGRTWKYASAYHGTLAEALALLLAWQEAGYEVCTLMPVVGRTR